MDVVIADVPCSGYGIIRKKPDIRYKDPDTMNDLPGLQLQILCNQARYVRPGGALIFDVSTPWKLENVLGDELIVEDREDVTYMWQNSFNKKTGVCDMALCFFLLEKDGRYRRIDESQKQRAHTREGLTALLTSCGFVDVHVYGNSRMESPRDKEQRWHFTARRSEEA